MAIFHDMLLQLIIKIEIWNVAHPKLKIFGFSYGVVQNAYRVGNFNALLM